MTSAEHDRKLAAIRSWFAALEPNIAELQITPSPYNDGYTHVDIRPVCTPDAAPILLRIEQEHGWVFVYASALRDEDPGDWPDLTFLDACKAIMAGHLIDTIHVWRGKEVAHTTCLHMPNENIPNCHIGFDGCMLPVLFALGTVLRRIEKRVVQYPPY